MQPVEEEKASTTIENQVSEPEEPATSWTTPKPMEHDYQADLDNLEDEIFNSDLQDDELNELLEKISNGKEKLQGHPDQNTAMKGLIDQVRKEFESKKNMRKSNHMSFGPLDKDEPMNTPG